VQRHFLVFAGAAALFIPLLLIADRRGLVPQLALGAATAAFLWLFARGSNEGRQIGAAILIATTGEVVLSLGWGLYSYRNALIPLYVPFGHGVFYALAAESARQPALRRLEQRISRGVLVAGSVIAAVGFAAFKDQWGLVWWIAAAICLMRSRNRLLLSMAFIDTMLLEWLGTTIGNWHWTANVPFVGLHSANPPSGVGLLYVLLDLVTVAICSSTLGQRAHAPVNLAASFALETAWDGKGDFFAKEMSTID
jgi:hypothetical protein